MRIVPMLSFLLLAGLADGSRAETLKFRPLDDDSDRLLARQLPAPDSHGRAWTDLDYNDQAWEPAERDWHPHWCGGSILDPNDDQAPTCGPRDAWGGGFVPWITPRDLGWTLDLRQTIVHRRSFILPGASEGFLNRVLLWATADDIPNFYVNGVKLDQRAVGYQAWGFWDITGLVKPGRNVVASLVVQMEPDSPCALTYLIEAEFTGRNDLVLAPVGADLPLSGGLVPALSAGAPQIAVGGFSDFTNP